MSSQPGWMSALKLVSVLSTLAKSYDFSTVVWSLVDLASALQYLIHAIRWKLHGIHFAGSRKYGFAYYPVLHCFHLCLCDVPYPFRHLGDITLFWVVWCLPILSLGDRALVLIFWSPRIHYLICHWSDMRWWQQSQVTISRISACWSLSGQQAFTSIVIGNGLWILNWCGLGALVGQKSWSLWGRGPNSAASSILGSLIRIFCRQPSACNNTLACPWWSLEGLLAAAQNWPISYQKVLKKNSSACWHSCLERTSSACRHSCWAPQYKMGSAKIGHLLPLVGILVKTPQ